MASALLRSFPVASSITTGETCRRSKKSTKYCYTSSYALRASWSTNEDNPKEHHVIKLSPQNNLKRHYKRVEMLIGSNDNKCEKKYYMNATSSDSHESELQAQHHVSKDIISKSIKDAIDVFMKFSRPYVTLATILGVTAASFLAVENLSDISPAFFIGLLQHAAASQLSFVYANFMNDYYDIEIDKINKPYHALASGQYSTKTGVFVGAVALFVSVGLGWISGSRPMLWGILASTFLSTAYSANFPLLRWKRFTPLTLVYIVGHPWISSSLAPYLHMKTHVLGRAAILSRSMIFILVMNAVYLTCIAIAKDIPDMEGDKAGGIQTLAVRIGAEPVFWICISFLAIGYGGAIWVGATSPFLWNKIVMVSAHAIMALYLWYIAQFVDFKKKTTTNLLYKNIFKLYCIEAIVMAIAR